jgi:glycine hydroxymethyltransferase
MKDDGEIDWDSLESQAVKFSPKIIFSGGTGYTKIFKWERYARIAQKVGALFVADISHIAGLVAGGAHPSPVPFADVVMTTTHKTLRGPRGAMIMVTHNGILKDALLPEKIDKAVFPGLQGGPHMETVAGIAVALEEASGRDFKRYSSQVVANAQGIAEELVKRGYALVGGGTENHMIWIDLRNKGIDGWTAAWALEAANIIANRQTIPNDTRSNYYPSGLRLGTPAITTRGMKEKEMKQISQWIAEVIDIACVMVDDTLYDGLGGEDKEADQLARKNFKKEVLERKELIAVKKQVMSLCKDFPIFRI